MLPHDQAVTQKQKRMHDNVSESGYVILFLLLHFNVGLCLSFIQYLLCEEQDGTTALITR
jgi:hypothetical protein